MEDIPLCCKNCLHFGNDWDEWSGRTYYYCERNVWFPTRKGTCKKQDELKKRPAPGEEA